MSFTTQATSLPPTTITGIKVFSDNGFNNQLPDGTTIAAATDVFVAITAIDASPTTFDTTEVTLSTSVSGKTDSFSLIETTAGSGEFRGIVRIFDDESAVLTLSSATDPGISASLQTFKMPRYLSIQPASGTSRLYLDTVFNIETNKALAAATVNKNNILLVDSNGIASYTVSMPAADRIKIQSDLKPSETYQLKLGDAIKDTDGISFNQIIANFSSLDLEIKDLKLFADATYMTQIAEGAEVETGQTIYIRLSAINAYLNKEETATATFSEETATQTLQLGEISPGEFAGSLIVPAAPGRTLTVAPESRVDLARRLRIIPAFTLVSFSPASGSIGVAADVWPTWNFNRPVNPDDLTSANFGLINITRAAAVPVRIQTGITGYQVRMEPIDGILPLLEVFEMRLSGSIRDVNGNVLGTALQTRFMTQTSPPPPNDIISLKNYESAAYATSTLAVAHDDSLYLELVAADTSFSTYETSRVRIESTDRNLDGLELTLIEIAPPSGIYRLAIPINLAPDTLIRVISQASPNFSLEIMARNRTRLLTISPASGSLNLHLDQPVSFTFSQRIDESTVSRGITILASDSLNIPFTLQARDSGQTLTLTPGTAYASSTQHTFAISTDLRDINGLYLLPETAFLTTRSDTEASFELFTGLSPRAGQKVSLTGEAVAGTVQILASCTSMFLNTPETRNISFSTSSASFTTLLTESSAGLFSGSADLSGVSEVAVQAKLLSGNQPVFNFNIATLPALLGISPASDIIDVDELPGFTANFTRKMAYESGNGALQVQFAGGIVNTTQTGNATDSTVMTWNPLTALPVQASCTLLLSGVTDYLGQVMPDYRHVFSTGRQQGISIFSDGGFSQLITAKEVSFGQLFVEVTASNTQSLTGRTFNLKIKRGTMATQTLILPLQPISATSGIFRCSLAIADNKAVPEYAVPLLPGEWLEATAEELTTARRLLYYRHSSSVGPQNLKEIRFFTDRHYMKPIRDILPSPVLYIEVEGEDQNWFTTDKTRVKVTSDSDLTGFELELGEIAPHSDFFRNFIRLVATNSDKQSQSLKVLPGQNIYVVSLSDPGIRSSIRYVPESSIGGIAVFPNPARGDSITFRFNLNFATDVRLEIFDTAGDKIQGFVIRGREGTNDFRWRFPRHLANGVYFYQMKIDLDKEKTEGKRKGRGKFAVLR